MIHMEKQYEATCAPAVIGVAIPASEARVRDLGLNLSQHMAILIDDNVKLAGDGEKVVAFSEVATTLLANAGIEVHKRGLSISRLMVGHPTGDNGGPIDAMTDIVEAFCGNQYRCLLIPLGRAEEALKILSLSDETLRKSIAEQRALSYRGAARSFLGGAQCTMAAGSAFMSSEIFDLAIADLKTTGGIREEFLQQRDDSIDPE